MTVKENAELTLTVMQIDNLLKRHAGICGDIKYLEWAESKKGNDPEFDKFTERQLSRTRTMKYEIELDLLNAIQKLVDSKKTLVDGLKERSHFNLMTEDFVIEEDKDERKTEGEEV